MNESPEAGDLLTKGSDRRSSVRVRSLLPFSIRRIDEEEVAAIESKILDLAVMESDAAFDDESMWDGRSDDLRREVVLLLNEIRSLRQKVTQLERFIDQGEAGNFEERWVTLNDRGFWFVGGKAEPEFQAEDLLEVRIQLPSMHTQRVLAIGEIIRVDHQDEGLGVAVEFRSISEIHEKAIMRYALMRERQVARSARLAGMD